MADRAELGAAWATLKTGTLWKQYAKANPNESTRLDQYAAILTAGQPATRPAPLTATGKGLAGILHAGFQATPVTIKPPAGKATAAMSINVTVRGTTALPESQDYDTVVGWAESSMLTGWSAFSLADTVTVTSQSELATALSTATAGDLIDCTGAFTVSGELEITCQPAGPVKVDLKTGVNAVKFVGGAGAQLPAVWLHGCKNLYFYGGDLTNASTSIGGAAIIGYDCDHIRWWDAVIHDCADTGVTIEAKTIPIAIDIRWSGTNCGYQLAWDPHLEKGTGTHFCYLGGGTSGPYPIGGRIALDVDYQKYGHVLQANHTHGLAIYLRGDRIGYGPDGSTFDATSQHAGSALEVWGDHPSGSTLQFYARHIEMTHSRGRPFDMDSTAASLNLSTSTVDYGRASDCNQNPDDWYSDGIYWKRRSSGVQLLDVIPLP